MFSIPCIGRFKKLNPFLWEGDMLCVCIFIYIDLIPESILLLNSPPMMHLCILLHGSDERYASSSTTDILVSGISVGTTQGEHFPILAVLSSDLVTVCLVAPLVGHHGDRSIGWRIILVGHSFIKRLHRFSQGEGDCHTPFSLSHVGTVGWKFKGTMHTISPGRNRVNSNSCLPAHHWPTLWHWMLIILILLIHATTRQQWNASW